MFKKAVVVAMTCGALLAGCDTDLQAENQEILSNLIEAGFPADDIQVVDGAVYVGRDAHVTLEASREMLQAPEGSPEQYRTTNLVGLGVTKICVNPTSTFNSYPNLSRGLDLAIANYNERGLRITFARGPATGCTANITAETVSGIGGSSGFPSGGLPYGVIKIGTGMSGYSEDMNEHTITHELGHTIGFRHSDYYNRSISCGVHDEEPGSAGAILIPGTPGTATMGGSVMNSCFSGNENGEWTASDITALNYLYPILPTGPGAARMVPSGGFATGYWAEASTRLLTGDFNGDGKADFIAIHPRVGTYADTFLSSGTGTFTMVAAGGFSSNYWADGLVQFLPGDFNGDGRTDFVAIHPGGATYANTFLSNGNGTFTQVAAGGFSSNYWADGLVQFLPGDFNGDGRTDFVAIHPRVGTYANALLSNGNGTFRQVAAGGFSSNYSADGATRFLPGDVNADGRTDFVAIHPRVGTYANSFLSNGNGTFVQVAASGFSSNYSADGATRFLPGDVNADGKLDFIAIHPRVGTYANSFLSNGNGTFVQVAAGGFSSNYWAEGTTSFLPGDFNGDGRVDFIAIHPGGGTYANTFLSNSGGTFAQVPTGGFPSNYSADGSTRFLPGTFNTDGKTDFIAIHPGGGTYANTFLMY